MKKIILILSAIVSFSSVMGQGSVIGMWDFENNTNGWNFFDLGEENRSFTRGTNASFNSAGVTVPANPPSTYVMGYNDDVHGDDNVLTDVYMGINFTDFSMYDSVRMYFEYYNPEDNYYTSYIYVNTGGDHENTDDMDYYEIVGSSGWETGVFTFRQEDFGTAYFSDMSFGFTFYDEEWLEYGLFLDNIVIVGYRNSPNETCATAITLTPQANCSALTATFGNMSGASPSVVENDCLEDEVPTVWYKFVATAETMNFSAKASALYDLDLVVGFYEGGCDAANFIDCLDADDITGNGTGEESTVLSDLTIGETYYIQLSNYFGGTDLGEFSICISEYNACEAPVVSAPAMSVCDGETIVLTASGTEAVAWYKDGVVIENATASTFTATESGVYKVTLTDAACEDVFSNELTITIQDAIVSNFTYTICVGDTIVVGASEYTVAGTYQDILTAINGCDSTVNTTIIVTSMDINVVQNGVDFTATSTNGTTYSWVNCATEVEVATTLNFTATENGTYKLIVSDGTCSEESICYEVGSVSINKADAFTFAMYPNPATDVLVIDAGSQVVEMIMILDQNGRVVRSVQLNDVTPSISVNNLTAGLYFIQVTANGSTVTKKIAKQ